MSVLRSWLERLFGTPAPLPGEPVRNFQVERYLGTWYEVARLDHRFERGLSNVTAEYTLRPDGTLRVVNRGYSEREGRWKEAVGKAYLAGAPDQGYLKVSFFGPFYGAYLVLDLDHEQYRYALIAGPNTEYLWILSRTPYLAVPVLERLVGRAAALGFATRELIRVRHDQPS
ncbi:hypothetical protein GMLC_23250 [Geomonas limicola]|uniref:Lipocalin/cytosolic fatty-acid binding domain-containing protein n=1 Tax=Geomonas limicola TaxID=2740186 RepID=A0A6V8N844_9BACT|nr:lipocalin family protein [Geomonas limicola]GFO68746.1 hypothetical protein GMLC_23250 [Geomonas limicola]